MRKNKANKSGFFEEFKKFISKGNVIDLSVGIIIGGAFTAIVTALTTHIFTPLINYLISLMFKDGNLEAVRTTLGPVAKIDGEVDWSNTIYIDWGAFISAIINFFIIAFVLFVIIRTLNKAKETKEKIAEMEREKYYEKHPEERPAPVPAAVPAPTQEELLTQIRDILKEKK